MGGSSRTAFGAGPSPDSMAARARCVRASNPSTDRAARRVGGGEVVRRQVRPSTHAPEYTAAQARRATGYLTHLTDGVSVKQRVATRWGTLSGDWCDAPKS